MIQTEARNTPLKFHIISKGTNIIILIYFFLKHIFSFYIFLTRNNSFLIKSIISKLNSTSIKITPNRPIKQPLLCNKPVRLLGLFITGRVRKELVGRYNLHISSFKSAHQLNVHLFIIRLHKISHKGQTPVIQKTYSIHDLFKAFST